MTNRQVTHTIKLDWQLKLIAIILAVGVLLHALLPLVQPARAQSYEERLLESILEELDDISSHTYEIRIDTGSAAYYLKQMTP